MEMPVPLKTVRALCWLQIGVAALAIVVLLFAGVFHTTPDSVFGRARNGIVGALRVRPSTSAGTTVEITTGDGRGVLAGPKLFLLSAFPILILRFIRRRNLTGMRIVTGLELLATIGSGGLMVIPLAMFAAMFLQSTRKYIRQEEDGEIPLPRVIRSSQWEG